MGEVHVGAEVMSRVEKLARGVILRLYVRFILCRGIRLVMATGVVVWLGRGVMGVKGVRVRGGLEVRR